MEEALSGKAEALKLQAEAQEQQAATAQILLATGRFHSDLIHEDRPFAVMLSHRTRHPADITP